MDSQKKFCVCMLGAFDPDYPRHQIIRTGLERVGIHVKSVILRRNVNTLAAALQMFRRWSEIKDCNVILVPAFNQLLTPFVWVLAGLLRKPVLLDYMVGLTDSIVEERGEVPPIKAWLYRAVDRFNIRCFTSFTDTDAHVTVFQRWASTKKMSVIPVGVYDEWFNVQPPPDSTNKILVQFFGSYIPFHGVKIILDAISQFRDDPGIYFELIGRGQTYADCVKYAQRLNLKNVQFIDPIKPDELPARLMQAAICLGVFGAREKTAYVVPNKVYQCMAMARPVITAESPALDEFFIPGEHLITVKPGDPDDLALAIRRLVESPEERVKIGNSAAQRIQEAFLPQHIGMQVKALLSKP
ncbi:MAG: glycosyltransferase family protein [Aggregatilineales bacterium]